MPADRPQQDRSFSTAGGATSDLRIVLPEALVEAVAARAVELLAAQQPTVSSPWRTVDEAAERLRCSKQRIYDLTHSGMLTPNRDGRRLLFHVDALDQYLTGASS